TAIRYERAYSHSGVWAPSRSGILTGMDPTSIGTHHMRCKGIPPAGVTCFTEYLRAAGYYCTNNRKTDYQFAPPLSAWDESNGKAHWRHRPEETPFFSVFNFTVCHESRVRSRDPKLLAQIEALGPDKHDPVQATLPPYHADTPATRRDWAQYHDVITLMDLKVGDILAQLEADGLAEDTIVWFWGDHGRGLTRGKRWLYESGTRIPLLVHVPEKYRAWVRPGDPESLASGVNKDQVCFLDFAPTVLSLAGVAPPAYFQGQAFLGQAEAPPPAYIYGARDRMDETYDLIRTVRDKRFRYFRNYMPYVTYAQHIEYMDEMPMLQDLRRLHGEGKLNADQEKWFAPRKPLEELYDVEADPHELNNLVEDPKYHDVLLRLRKAHLTWMEETGDVGLISEPEYDAWKWRDGIQTVDTPSIQRNGERVAMAVSTPGATIIYRWADDTSGHWRLYSQPVPWRDGVALRVKASRAGFKDSPEITASEKGGTSTTKPSVHPVDRDDLKPLLAELRALRALDAVANDSVSVYLDTLAAPEASMRYWAIVLLHRMVDPALRKPAWTDSFLPLLQDDSVAVRVAAAHALCDWGRAEKALPVLEIELSNASSSARLFAITALLQRGETARPVFPALKKATNDKSGDVAKVSRHAVARLRMFLGTAPPIDVTRPI
ncbi:MAG: sulfatase, partial [Candidatus Hydrogenedentes bacterium]|nr:sulfatase [Candidatus Hydrogenedentota bacterium]